MGEFYVTARTGELKPPCIQQLSDIPVKEEGPSLPPRPNQLDQLTSPKAKPTGIPQLGGGLGGAGPIRGILNCCWLSKTQKQGQAPDGQGGEAFVGRHPMLMKKFFFVPPSCRKERG